MLRVLLNSMIVQMKMTYARNMYKVCFFVLPITSAIITYEMLRNSGLANFATYAVITAGLNALWGCICFSSVGDINRERYSGTLSIVYVAPSGFNFIMLGKMIGNTLMSIGTIAISTLTIVVLYQPTITIVSPLYFILSTLLLIICIITFAFFLAQILTLSRKTEVYMNALDGTVTFLCAFAFPVSILPIWVQPISYALPPTWGVKMLKLSAEGIAAQDFIVHLLLTAAVVLVYLIAIYLLRKTIDYQVRKSGSLEMR